MSLFVKERTFEEALLLNANKTFSQAILSLFLAPCSSFLEDHIKSYPCGSFLGIKSHLGRCCSVSTTSASHVLLFVVYLTCRWSCLPVCAALRKLPCLFPQRCSAFAPSIYQTQIIQEQLLLLAINKSSCTLSYPYLHECMGCKGLF